MMKKSFLFSIILFLMIPTPLFRSETAKSASNDELTKTEKDLPSRPTFSWPPAGKIIRCPVTRDTWVSSMNNEEYGNNGGADRLKLKSYQEVFLFDIDCAALKGKIITGALLHLRSASSKKSPMMRLGISSLASEWIEGTSKGYRPQVGSSCFRQAEYKVRDWAYPGSTLMDVVFGKGNTIWKFANNTSPDRKGWQVCAIDPDVIAARAAKLSYGFCAYDEVGNEWSLTEGEFRYRWFPNRFCYSRERKGDAPWLEVWVDGEDRVPPDQVTAIHVDRENLPPGEAVIEWETPKDMGGGKTLGFIVTCLSDNREIEFPRYLVPMAGNPGEPVRMHIQDMNFRPGEERAISIKAVDSAGNIGKPFTTKIRLSSDSSIEDLLGPSIEPFEPGENFLNVGGMEVAVVDLLDKIDPQNGKMIPYHAEAYKRGNHIFSTKKKRVRLQGARNEAVTFQVNLAGKAEDVSVSYRFINDRSLKTKVYESAYVDTSGGKDPHSFLPDPLVELKGTLSIPSKAGKVQVPSQKNHSIVCEVYIPHDIPPGEKMGILSIDAGSECLVLDVQLTVWNFTLPDKLSFVPEMNAYWVVSPYEGYEYYRLAHEHRTCMNRLPYGWNGKPAFAPEWNGYAFDWSEWDKKVGPLLDGAAFRGLPRDGEPVDVLYLPFNENWPVDIFDNYSPSYWADEAFGEEYTQELKKAFAAFAIHCNNKGWHDTIFQFYLNNKIYYRREFKYTSSPWIFDEPVNTQDFWALRWYGQQWHSAVDPVMGDAKMWFRGDISYTQLSRNMFWNIMDIEYIGNNNPQKTRMKYDEEIQNGRPARFAEYGTVNKIDGENTQPVMWCLSAWTKGAMNILPWQTIGTKNSWKKAEQNALFYPEESGPAPSIRLKAFRRGQQDVEYLTLLCNISGVPRHRIKQWLQEVINLKGNVLKSSENDAGTFLFEGIHPSDLWKIRYMIGSIISKYGPEFQKNLCEWGNGHKNKKVLPDIGYVSPSPIVDSHKPICDTFAPE
jgi:hypothetical protein